MQALSFSVDQCGWRDSNSQGKATRPSNVRVYQFRHIRVGGLRQTKSFASLQFLSIPLREAF